MKKCEVTLYCVVRSRSDAAGSRIRTWPYHTI